MADPILTVLCTMTGHNHEFVDDGNDAAGKPKVRRLMILAAAEKKIPEHVAKREGLPELAGKKVFRAAVRKTDSKGRVTFEPIRIADPDLDGKFADLDAGGEKLVRKSLERRAKVEEGAMRRDGRDLLQALKRNLDKLMVDAPAAPAPAPEGKTDA